VSKEYRPRYAFSGGRIIKVVFDASADHYLDLDNHFAAAFARD
jgi:hypothetical protein